MNQGQGGSAAMSRSAWRQAKPEDRDDIIEMSLALYREDPGLRQVDAAQVRTTLTTFERQPWRGRAVVLDVDAKAAGYALLVPYYSNEFGGEICGVDELFVRPVLRSRGFGTALFQAIEDGGYGSFVGIALAVTPGNQRAYVLYERLAFERSGVVLVRPATLGSR